jgi:hypothetical protein
MIRLAWIVLVASALLLPLGGCASIGDALDPTEWFSGDWFGTKKKLPGERKPVFPEGVPGVVQGIPSDLVKGNQPPPGSSYAGEPQVTAATPQAAAPEEFKPAPREEAKPKPKAKAKAKPKEPAAERTPTAVTVRRTPESQQGAQPQQEPQPQQQNRAGGAVEWPDPPPLRTGQPGGVQWPDPPPLR